nr:transposase, MuDR, MULE transposase domain protein [Tanacetum cinerariifolium]
MILNKEPTGDGDSDHCTSDESYFSHLSSNDDDGDVNEILNYDYSNAKKSPTMEVSSKFPNVVAFRRALNHHAVINEYDYFIEKSDLEQFTARRTQQECPWRIHASIKQDDITFEVKNLTQTYTCTRSNMSANAYGISTLTIPYPVTTEEKAQKKNDVKARSMLLMRLPNEHLLTFSQYNDAKTLFEAIQARFGGNDATKKTQKTLLKQMYENFNAPSTDTVSTPVSTVSTHDNIANLSDATVYAFLANQPNGSQLVHEDLEQIYEDDLEEMDLKWPRNQDSSRKTVNVEDTSFKAMVAIDGVGFDWSYMADDEAPTNMALMDFSDSNEFQHPEFKGYGPKASKSVRVDTSNEIKEARDASIIKYWVFDSDEDKSEVMVLKYDNVQYTPEQANQPRKVSQNPRNNRTNWNEMRTQKLGMVQKPVLKNVEKGTGQREVRPVWNNTMRINNQNFSNSKRNFAPTAVLTKSGIVPISTARVTSAVGKQGINAVKFSACWVWRPKIKGDLQDALKDQGYFDSVYSRHMTRNISYLIDFKEHDGGYVAFGGGDKGGKITGKGTIRTDKLDFEDVYFVKEL